MRIFPHRMHGEGHFLALLKKGEGPDARGKKERADAQQGRKRKEAAPELEEFSQKFKIDLSCCTLDIHGERVYDMPVGLPDMRGMRFLRTGLLLGENRKNRFEPSQALAMALPAGGLEDVISLPADDGRVIRYLKGETLDVEDVVSPKKKGWQLFCVDGFPLGWGKLSGGTLKNKYLPGWRWQSV